MSPERLRAILAAYGARPERWPEAERAEALRLLALDPASAPLVEAEAALDALLHEHQVAAPDAALLRRALAAIPKPVGGLSILRGWWLGAALAGAGLAGAVVGALVLAVAAPPLLEQQALAWAEQQPTIFDASYLGENGL